MVSTTCPPSAAAHEAEAALALVQLAKPRAQVALDAPVVEHGASSGSEQLRSPKACS